MDEIAIHAPTTASIIRNGKIQDITVSEKGETSILFESSDGKEVKQVIPAGLKVIVSKNSLVQIDQPLTQDPNVGGFGQTETEIVLVPFFKGFTSRVNLRFSE